MSTQKTLLVLLAATLTVPLMGAASADEPETETPIEFIYTPLPDGSLQVTAILPVEDTGSDAEAGGTSTCGGFAPFNATCSGSGSFDQCCTWEPTMTIPPGGTVTNSGASHYWGFKTLTWSITCTNLILLEPACEGGIKGTAYMGGTYRYDGSVGDYTVGEWSVGIANPI